MEVAARCFTWRTETLCRGASTVDEVIKAVHYSVLLYQNAGTVDEVSKAVYLPPGNPI